MLVEPALDGVSLAILFFGAVLRCDELRHQRDDFGMARRDDRRRQHGVIRLNLAVGAFARQAVRAAELLRAKRTRFHPKRRAFYPQSAEGLAQWRLGQQSFQTFETGGEQRRVRFVEHVADVIVGRNFLDAEQALAIRPAMAFLQSALNRTGKKRSARKTSRTPTDQNPPWQYCRPAPYGDPERRRKPPSNPPEGMATAASIC